MKTLPALRTVHAVLSHTALQSMFSSSELARLNVGLIHGEKPSFSEESIWPLPMIAISSARTWPLFLLTQHSPKTPAYKTVKGVESMRMRMLEVLKPTFDGRIEIGYDFLDAVTARSTSL